MHKPWQVGWQTGKTPVTGGLALVLLLDQMSRNLNRGTPGMFAHDAQAVLLAKRARGCRR
jgi:uncharacterized protein (DUF924 family)